MDIPRAHLNSLAIHCLDEPALLEKNNPLRMRTFVPVPRPPDRQNSKVDRLDDAGERLYPVASTCGDGEGLVAIQDPYHHFVEE